MARPVGDGTGMGGPKGDQASTADQDAKPNATGGEYGQGEDGRGSEMSKGGNRTSPIKK